MISDATLRQFTRRYGPFGLLVSVWHTKLNRLSASDPALHGPLKLEYRRFKQCVDELLDAHRRGDISAESLQMIADTFTFAHEMAWRQRPPQLLQDTPILRSGPARPTTNQESREGDQPHA
jgi:hypothetical protein